MGFDFKKIKGLFIQEVDNPNKPKEEESKDKKKGAGGEKDILEMLKNKDKAPATETPVTLSGKPDPKIMDSLIKALEDNNLPGEDYMEFAAALQSMSNIALEESVKIQTVLATLSTRGLTREKILESGSYYLGILDKEKAKFAKALEKQVKDSVTTKQDEITALEALNKTKTAQIADLTREITENQKEIENIKVKIAENETKIKSTEGNFALTFEFITKQLQANIDKINALTPPETKK